MEAPKNHSSYADLMLTSSWIASPGMPDFRNLGDLYLSKKNLTLTCMSRERLEAGNLLLIAILGNKIHHHQDQFEEFKQQHNHSDRIDENDDSALEDKYDEEGDMGDESEIVEQEIIERMTLRWLDTPDHEGVTPRQSTQTPEGRELIRETLKCLEFFEEEAVKLGKKPPMRLGLIRDELGFQ